MTKSIRSQPFRISLISLRTGGRRLEPHPNPGRAAVAPASPCACRWPCMATRPVASCGVAAIMAGAAADHVAV